MVVYFNFNVLYFVTIPTKGHTMPELPKELWAFLGIALGGFLTFFTSMLATGSKIRHELREDNKVLRERMTALEETVATLIDERLEWRRERADLIRKLDKRDIVIQDLKREVEDLTIKVDHVSEPIVY